MQKRSSIANNRRKVILLQNNTRPHVAESMKQTILQLEWISSVLSRLGTVGLPSFPINATRTYGHFSVTKKSKNGWMNESPRKTPRSTIVGLPCYRRKSSRKLFWLRLIHSSFLWNKSILKMKKRQELSSSPIV